MRQQKEHRQPPQTAGCKQPVAASQSIRTFVGVHTELHPISEVANLEKKVPLSWMNNNHTQMTEDFLDYARPLIQAELTPLYIAGLPHHIYMKNQK